MLEETLARKLIEQDVYKRQALEELKNLKGKKAIVVVGGGAMKRQGFLAKVEDYLKEAGMEVALFEGVEPDPSVETVMKGAKAMQEFEPDWIVAMGGGSPIDAAKAMWAFYEYPVSYTHLLMPEQRTSQRKKTASRSLQHRKISVLYVRLLKKLEFQWQVQRLQ